MECALDTMYGYNTEGSLKDVEIVVLGTDRDTDAGWWEKDLGSELRALWDAVRDRVDYWPCSHDLTPETQDGHPLDCSTGGLISDEDDAAEVFIRLARLRGVEVREFTIQPDRSSWVNGLAWSADEDARPEYVESVLETLRQCAAGEVYVAVVSEVTADEDGDYEIDGAEDSLSGMVGYDSAEDMLKQLDGIDQAGIEWKHTKPGGGVYETIKRRID